jgi:sRNA-binding protein
MTQRRTLSLSGLLPLGQRLRIEAVRKQAGLPDPNTAPQRLSRLEWATHQRRIRSDLCRRFPHAFPDLSEAAWPPLKVGTAEDIKRRAPDLTEPAQVFRSVIREHVNDPRYLRGSVAGASRIDLDGQPSGTVSEREAAWALTRLKLREAQP